MEYLKYTGSCLELGFMNNIINKAEIVSMQRDGGYKEPFHKVVHYSFKGYECLNSLESILSVQLNCENEKIDSHGNKLSKKIVLGKKEL